LGKGKRGFKEAATRDGEIGARELIAIISLGKQEKKKGRVRDAGKSPAGGEKKVLKSYKKISPTFTGED